MTRGDDDRLKAVLERGLDGILVTSAVVVFVGALAMMVTMDAASRSQGGRLFVAVGATVVLGWLDTQQGRAVERRAPWSLVEPAQVRRYRILSLTVLGACVLVLFGAALLLPDRG